MPHDYYEAVDLENFPTISELSTELGKKFFDYYESATAAGKLTEREKTLIALAVAHTERCPYCIDAFTNKSLSLGISKEEMMEAVHVGAVMQAGVSLVHAVQMKKIAEKKEM